MSISRTASGAAGVSRITFLCLFAALAFPFHDASLARPLPSAPLEAQSPAHALPETPVPTLHPVAPVNPKIGQMHQGGIVFWLDGKGGGLVVAPDGWNGKEGEPQARFGCTEIRIKGMAEGVGAGKTNTRLILEQCPDKEPTAARIASDAVINGFDDWYLPSKEEMKLLYDALHVTGLQKLRYDFYWTSTQSSGLMAWSFSFAKGIAYSYDKMDSDHVRPIRRF